jgi:predicted TIM-barrel fold metal-dependent hydrolase
MNTVLDDMSARDVSPDMKKAAAKVPSFIISADSHVDEPPELFDALPEKIRSRIERPKLMADVRPKGGRDPKVRIADMDLDGVKAEVLYPTYTLALFAAEPDVQEACFRVYNDWIADYCKTSPKRLFGIPCLNVYDIKGAIKELQRCHDMGLRGGLVWQVPDPKLPFTSDHYEPLWAAAAEIGYPLNFHILTGFNYTRGKRQGMEKIRGSVNHKTADAVTTLFDLIWSGVFERHPKMKAEIVESEIGWMPFVIQQWDYYFKRNFRSVGSREEFLINRLPSEIFNSHVYATFMDDYVGGQVLKFWGDKNCMWSSDYPHPNMTWPNSRAFIAREIGDLEPARQKRVLSQNVIDLYKLEL